MRASEQRPTERVLERLRLARPPADPVPQLDERASLNDWREAYNELAQRVDELQRRVESPQYGLWMAAISAATAVLLQIAS